MLNRLKPYNYLTYVMEKMKDLGPFPEKEVLLELLPWSKNQQADEMVGMFAGMSAE